MISNVYILFFLLLYILLLLYNICIYITIIMIEKIKLKIDTYIQSQNIGWIFGAYSLYYNIVYIHYYQLYLSIVVFIFFIKTVKL